MIRAVIPAALAAVLAGGGAAHGTISILKSDGTAPDATEATLAYNPATGGWDVTLSALYAPGLETVYTVRGNGGERIDNIFIDVPCWQAPDGECAPAGSPVMVHVFSDPPLGIQSIGAILQRGDAETHLLDVQAELDIGSVQAENIGTVVAGRDILGPIVATTLDNATRGVFWVEARRDLLGDVITEGGRIARVWAYRDIGTAADPVSLVARHKINGIFAGDGTCWLTWLNGLGGTCAGDIHADIETRYQGGTGGIFRFFAGRFFGTLDARIVTYDTATGTPGTFTITNEFDGRIDFGVSHTDPAKTVELPGGGFAGQIVFNADGQAGGTWAAPIRLGCVCDPQPTILGGVGYAQTALDLGGGSVGAVPFDLHDESCAPANGGAVADDPDSPVTVRLRHYGPVALAGPAPLLVEARPLGSILAFAPVAPGELAYAVDPADPNTLLVTAAGELGGFQGGWEYRMQPTADLVCDVPSAPPVAWTQTYAFGIEVPPCDGDVDGNGFVDIIDLLGLVSYWGSVTPQSVSADFDGSGVVDITDLLTVLANWGPC